MPVEKIDKAALQQKWLHSHEEDTADTMVFRPSSFKFGPARGRGGFELKPDGELVESLIAPADGSLLKTGKWKLSGAGKLSFYRDDPSAPAKVLEIESADKDKLVIKRQ
jgi:hypothetical protein